MKCLGNCYKYSKCASCEMLYYCELKEKENKEKKEKETKKQILGGQNNE